MSDDDEPPIFPLLGYGTGIVDGTAVVSLELATDREEYDTREGSWVSAAMSGEQAIEFGNALIELGERLKGGGTVN
jgi:hypothetical protein